MSGTLRRVVDEAGLTALAAALAPALAAGGVIHLHGDLGAGKTTFARALLRTLGAGTRIKSPTYSLVESYRADGRALHHLDLYRIADPGELEWLGLADLADPGAVLLIEWPERGGDALPPADLAVRLAHAGAVRDLAIEAVSAPGRAMLDRLRAAVESGPT